MPKLKAGDLAPDFTAQLSTDEKMSLSSFRGKKKVVLYFYPKDFTTGCTREACYFRDYKSDIEDLNAEIFGVSLDSKESHQKFINRHSLNFALISDKDKKISKAYGTLRLGGLLNRRVTFVIDTKGFIRQIIRSETNMSKHLEEAIKTLKQLEEESSS